MQRDTGLKLRCPHHDQKCPACGSDSKRSCYHLSHHGRSLNFFLDRAGETIHPICSHPEGGVPGPCREQEQGYCPFKDCLPQKPGMVTTTGLRDPATPKPSPQNNNRHTLWGPSLTSWYRGRSVSSQHPTHFIGEENEAQSSPASRGWHNHASPKGLMNSTDREC